MNNAGSKRRVEVDKEVMDKRSGILLMDSFWPFFITFGGLVFGKV